MKLYLSLLVILLMADACWSSHCRWANWWISFDNLGWSRCHTREYVRGFYRNGWTPADPINLLENGICCKAPYPYENTRQTCQITTDWWYLLDYKNIWAKCPDGYFVQDLYRSSGNGVSNIEKALCCKPETLSVYGDCYDDTDVTLSFDRKGDTLCRTDYYLTGIYKGNCNHLYCIEKFRCCKMT